jgi:hypothetical protein
MDGGYKLTPEQQANISIEDLAQLILQILNRNLSAPPGSRRRSYHASSLPGIRAFEFEDEPAYGLGNPHPQFRSRFQEAVELLRQRGLIYPDPSQNSLSGCFLLTERGRAADSSDPVFEVSTAKGLIGRIEKDAGRELDEVAAAYFSEAFDALHHDMPLSCAFTLGAAAERLILKTADLVKDDLADPATEAAYDKCRGVKDYQRFIEDHLKPLRKRHSTDDQLFGDLDTKVSTLYGFYRLTRNEAGHPDDAVPKLSRDDLKANLASFRSFASAILRVWTIIE